MTTPPRYLTVLVPILSVLLSFAITSVVLVLRGADIASALSSFAESIMAKNGIAELFVKATPLLFVGLGITVAFKCKVFNIGGEGQIIMGSIIATWIGITFTNWPALVIIPIILISGFLMGGFWGGIVGGLKAKFGINEVIATIMMNYVAIYLLEYLLLGPLGVGGAWTQSPIISEYAQLPHLIAGTRLHIGFLIAFLMAALVWVLLFKTILGYRIRASGAGPEAARYGGVNTPRIIAISMLISGGLAGIAGAVEVMGTHLYLLPGISGNYGYMGIIVALLGRLHPTGIVIAAFGFSALIIGTQAMLRVAGIPLGFMLAVIGLILVFEMIGELMTQYKIRRT